MEIKPLSLADQLRMIKGVEPIQQPRTGESSATSNKPSFLNFLEKSVNEANELGLDVDRKIRDTIEGTAANPHETIIAIQKADISFRLMLAVKDQLEQAYQQIMRTSIG